MCIRPLAHLEPPVLLRRSRVDANGRKPSNVVCPPARIDDVNGLLTGGMERRIMMFREVLIDRIAQYQNSRSH